MLQLIAILMNDYCQELLGIWLKLLPEIPSKLDLLKSVVCFHFSRQTFKSVRDCFGWVLNNVSGGGGSLIQSECRLHVLR
jgi:hypothetical protein